MRNEPQWSDTIWILAYVLLLTGLGFCWWLTWVDWGAGSTEPEIDGGDIGGGSAGGSGSSAVGWLWLLGTIASLSAAFGVLRHSRSRTA